MTSVCLARRDLQRHAVVATIETVDGLGRNKLEHDGIRRLVPAKHKAKDRQDKAVETKDDAPDGLAVWLETHSAIKSVPPVDAPDLSAMAAPRPETTPPKMMSMILSPKNGAK